MFTNKEKDFILFFNTLITVFILVCILAPIHLKDHTLRITCPKDGGVVDLVVHVEELK